MENPRTWKRISSDYVADCDVFRVRKDACVRDGDEKQNTFYIVENPDWVNVIALTKQNELVLIEQYRPGTEETILEIPGGVIDEDEEPQKTAERELLEETGFSAEEWIRLGKSRPNSALQTNSLYHYLARGCSKTAEPSFDPNESIITRLVPLAEVKTLVTDGKINDSLVIAALYYMGLQDK